MKILHVLHSSLPLLSGYSIRTQNILINQKHFCNPVGITSPYFHRPNKEETIDSIKYHRTNKSIRTNLLFQSSLPFFKHYSLQKDFEKNLRDIVEKNKPDIIHAHSSHNIAFPAFRVAKKYGIPFVYEIRGLWEEAEVVKGSYTRNSIHYKYNRYCETYIAKKAEKVFVISESLKDHFIQRQISPNKIVVIPNGVTKKSIITEKINQLKNEFRINGNTVIGYIGSLNKYESLELFLNALSQLVQKHKDVKGIIVGGGSEFLNLKKLSNELKIKSHLIFTGTIPPDIVSTYFFLIDIFLITRYIGREVKMVTPLKPYEAMAARSCLLMSDLPASREIVLNGKTGMLFKPGDVQDLVLKCEYLIEDKFFREKLGWSAKKWVLENRNWESVVSEYYEHYKQLI